MGQVILAVGDDPKPDSDPPADGVNYFRRAVRSNEMFFLYDPESANLVIKAFLETWRVQVGDSWRELLQSPISVAAGPRPRRRRLAWGSGIVSFLGGLVAVALLWPDVERAPETMSTEPAVYRWGEPRPLIRLNRAKNRL